MKQISDDQWEEIFLAGKRQQEREERELFERTLMEEAGELQSEGIILPLSDTSGRLQRSIPKSIFLEPDATLDLHLKTKHESTMELRRFFQQSAGTGDRSVLVITGKGHHSERKGVLRAHARQWLNGEGRRWILWFAEAPKKLGGSGAWLVRLKP